MDARPANSIESGEIPVLAREDLRKAEEDDLARLRFTVYCLENMSFAPEPQVGDRYIAQLSNGTTGTCFRTREASVETGLIVNWDHGFSLSAQREDPSTDVYAEPLLLEVYRILDDELIGLVDVPLIYLNLPADTARRSYAPSACSPEAACARGWTAV